MNVRLFSLILILIMVSGVTAQDYQNPDLSVEARVTDLLSRMTLEEKVGQMTLIEKNSLEPDDVTDYFIGGVLSGGGGYPTLSNSPPAWMEMVHGFQDAALATRLGIPIIYGVDAVHGHGNLAGAVVFPHNIGLGATRNPELVEDVGRVTAREMIATGIYWNYAPVVAVPQDIRWGRTYEGFSEDTALVTELSTAMIQGLQGDDLSATDTVLATPKHYVGDGGTAFGTSPIRGALLDRGITAVDEATLRAIHLPPYIAAIENGARSIMISFSSWGGEQMHGQSYLIQDVLRDELGFEGFIVSDWAGVDFLAVDYYDAVVSAVNAGIDMVMVPQDFRGFTAILMQAVEDGDITEDRIDEAVSYILKVKFEMGLFEHPYGDEELQAAVGSDDHRAIAREAVSQSLVLLKNEGDALPIDPTTDQTIFLAGHAADNIGIQSGGWTIEWQGSVSNLTRGTTIYEALQDELSDSTTLEYSPTGQFPNRDDPPARADIGIVVIGELPYAEMYGDDPNLRIAINEYALLATMREQVDTLVVILISGRPLVINDALNLADAFVAAWLPGTEGNGITDVLFGDRDFVGTLPYTWLRSVDQLPFNFDNIPEEGCNAPLFPFGYGLTYASREASVKWLELAETCDG